MDDVYELLSALKAPKESFSEELRRLAKTKGSIMEFAGAWKMSEEEAEKMKMALQAMRRGTRLKELRERMWRS